MAKKKELAPFLIEDMKRFKTQRGKLPNEMANESVNFFQDNFRRQGFVDVGVIKWKKRKGEKRRTRKTKTSAKESRGILIQSGRLSRDIKKKRVSAHKIIVGTGSISSDYAGVHNYGLRSGRGKGFTMPKRKFIGHSRKLSKELIKLINFRLRKTFK